MYCPVCGQQQVSEETRFCSRCGFYLTNVSSIIVNGGALPQISQINPNLPSSRKRGMKQGGSMILLGIFLVPILGVLQSIFRFPSEVVGLAALILFLGGFLRLIYALLFESSSPTEKTLEDNLVEKTQKVLGKQKPQNALPPDQSIPVETYIPPQQANWRDTNDLQTPSVTDATTKFLDRK